MAAKLRSGRLGLVVPPSLLDQLSAATMRAHEALQRAIGAHARGDAAAYRTAMGEHDGALQEARWIRRQMSEPPSG